MKALINNVFSTHLKYEKACEKLNERVKEVCDFKAELTWCASDGHLILNEETTSVATLDCLNGRTVTNKLTENEHDKFCI